MAHGKWPSSATPAASYHEVLDRLTGFQHCWISMPRFPDPRILVADYDGLC